MFSVAAAAILKLHSRAPTASAPQPWLSSSLRALAEVLPHTLRSFLPWALESGTRCVGGGPAKISLSGSYHQSELLGDLGWEEASVLWSWTHKAYERQMS